MRCDCRINPMGSAKLRLHSITFCLSVNKTLYTHLSLVQCSNLHACSTPAFYPRVPPPRCTPTLHPRAPHTCMIPGNQKQLQFCTAELYMTSTTQLLKNSYVNRKTLCSTTSCGLYSTQAHEGFC